MDCKYVKPLNDKSDIERFFAECGEDVPHGFTEFFIKNNGGRPKKNECVLKNGSERLVNNFLSFNKDDKENIYKAIQRVAEDNAKLIPFAKDPGGDYFCLLDGRVVLWSHEDGETIEVADTFEIFCVMLV